MSAYSQTRRLAPAGMPGRAHAADAPGTRRLLTLALALLAAALLLLSHTAHGALVLVTANVAPPPLPVYEQPPLPAPGYMWVPGYWSWSQDDGGYYWVPGTWVLPPDPDLVWTPGYWGYSDGAYAWNPGYWAPEVGFYGGVVYGFGYFGHGYEGGYWRDNQFWYNRAVNNVGTTNVTNVYNRTVNNVTVNNISYNGGPGGVNARPTAQEAAAAKQPRHAPSHEQSAHVSAAAHQHELLASVNQGHPPVAATPKPGEFSGAGVVPARTATAHSGAVREAPANAAHNGGHAAGETGAARESTPEPSRPPAAEPPRRLAQAPGSAAGSRESAPPHEAAPPPTHSHTGPAERAAPPPESRAAESRGAPELSPYERQQVERPPPPAAPPPAERAQAPMPHSQQRPQQPPHEQPAPHEHAPPREQAPPPSHSRPPNGRPEDQPAGHQPEDHTVQ